MGEGSGRLVGSGRVGSGQTFGQQSRVGLGRVNVLPGRVQEKWPVDNSELEQRFLFWFPCFRGFSTEINTTL